MTETTSITHDFSGDRELITSVSRAVAEATGEDPMDMTPLYEALDPDAFHALFARRDRARRSGISVTFTYEGHEVTVYSDGEIVVRSESAGMGEPGLDAEGRR